jgi:transposase
MRKKEKATTIIKLLKKGYSPKEITQRVAVSYNYAWKLKKDLEAMVETLKPKPEPEVKAKAGEYIEVEGAKNAQEIDAILNTRASTYGSFVDVSRMAQRLKNVAHTAAGEQGKTFAADQAEALDMIFSKLARILNGDPNHTDSWIDIAGYATLVADRLQGKTR